MYLRKLFSIIRVKRSYCFVRQKPAFYIQQNVAIHSGEILNASSNPVGLDKVTLAS